MYRPMTPFPNAPRRPRTAVHAGPMVLDKDRGPEQLERYLAGADERKMFLVHHGQPRLRTVAREAGVEDVRLNDRRPRPEAERATEMAIALGAEEIEFTIDRPALENDVGRPIQEMTAHEAERLAADPSRRPEVRAKLRAACEALRRGMRRVRIGNPSALSRDRATVIVPDPPMAMGMALSGPGEDTSGDAASPPEGRPGGHPHRMPPSEPDRPFPMLARRQRPSRRRRRRLAYSPQHDCRMGPRAAAPFARPGFGAAPAEDERRRGRRMRYA